MENERYKDYRMRWVVEDINKVEKFPLHLDIETQTACNLRCTMCYQSFDTVKPAKMSIDVYMKIMKEAKENGLCAVKLQLRNEPLLDKRLPELIKIAKQHGIIDTMINTNATKLNKQMSKDIIEAGLDTIIFSIDGYTKDIYESIRIGSDFQSVEENVRNFYKIRKELGSVTPRIVIRTIERDDIDIERYISYWKDVSDSISYFKCMDLRPPEDTKQYPTFVCKDLWRRLSILADGVIVPCCNAAVGNIIYEPLGNIRKTTIKEAWDKVQPLRELHSNWRSDRIKMCRMCDIVK